MSKFINTELKSDSELESKSDVELMAKSQAKIKPQFLHNLVYLKTTPKLQAKIKPRFLHIRFQRVYTQFFFPIQ